MNDDFRVHFTLPSHIGAKQLREALRDTGLNHLLAEQIDHVAVSVDGNEVFLYAGSDDDAEQAAAAVTAFGTENGWAISPEIRRWHPDAEEWEDPSAPLPVASDAVAAEHANVITAERVESERYGFPEYEVRVECATHADTVALAGALRDEGIPSVRRFRYLLVGAIDEDSANRLAMRIGAMPGADTTTVAASPRAAEANLPVSRFALFGGLGA